MKRLTTLLLLLASMGAASAQNWAPFPLDETANWQIDYAWLDGSGCLYQNEVIYFIDGDSLINGTLYQHFSMYGYHWVENTYSWGCQEPPQYVEGSVGFFRADGGRYYRGEELMYDFTLNIGDTMETTLTEYPMVVENVDSVDMDGHVCRRLWFSSDLWILEGVGSSYGFDQSLYQFENWSFLNCYSHHGIPQIGAGTYCRLINDVSDEDVWQMTVSPNPSSGIFRIETSQASSYRIFDLLGRIINQGQLNGKSELDLTSQPNGIYLISVETEKGISTAKLVKHQ